MPERRPDVVEVVVLAADAHALLRRRRPLVVARLLPQEHVLELVHPGVGEEQRRVVVGHERRAGHDAVAVPLEVLEERRANLLGGHWLYCKVRLKPDSTAGGAGGRGCDRSRSPGRSGSGRDAGTRGRRRCARGRGAASASDADEQGVRDRDPERPRRRLAMRSTWRCPPPRSAAAPAAGPASRSDVSVLAIAPATRSSSMLRSSLRRSIASSMECLAFAASGEALTDLRFRQLAPGEHLQGDEIRVVRDTYLRSLPLPPKRVISGDLPPVD